MIKNLSIYSGTQEETGLIVIEWMTKHSEWFHLTLLFTLKKRYCFLHNDQIKKLQNPGRVYDSFLSFLVICSKFLRGEIICGDKRLCFSRQADLMVQHATRVQSPSVSFTSRTKETSAFLVLIRSERIPILAFILTKEQFSSTNKSWWRLFPHTLAAAWC